MMLLSVQTVPRSKCGARSPGGGGFSLVEVTVAVGICAFVILALVGLMATGLTSAREASRDTATAGMAEYVLHDLKTRAYGAIAAGPVDPYWFSQDGAWLQTPSADAIYRCDVAVAPADPMLIPESLRPAEAGDLGLRLRLSFSRVLETNQPPEIFETTIARY
jgi:uncharacterized protein (TIGR02598 family)